MLKNLCCLALLCFYSTHAFSQQPVIDTLPFSVAKKLLVIKGTLNGADVDFAFDTGAELGVLNTATQQLANSNMGTRKKSVKDANNNTVRGQKITIETLTIGSFKFTDVKSLFTDMEFLQCNALYLLGQNVIGKFNWFFNFENNTVQVSKTAFNPDSSFTQMPITGASKRPFTEIQIGTQKLKNCLIDFGYSGVLYCPESNILNKMYSANNILSNGSIGIYSTMGLGGLGKPDTLKAILLDGVTIGNAMFNKVLVNIPEKTDLKIGVGFFSGYCSAAILNHSTSAYYIKSTKTPKAAAKTYDARISIVDGKFRVTGKNLAPNSSAAALTIGEEVKLVAGKTVAAYGPPCDYFNWINATTENELTIEKMNGEKLVIRSGWMR